MKKLFITLIACVSILAASPSAAVMASPAVETGVADKEPRLNVVPGGVELTASSSVPTRFMVYSITGVMVKNVEVPQSSTVFIDVPAGYYIVKCGEWSRRILVK